MEKDIRRILVIGNDKEIQSLIIDFIKDEGYEADSVEKGTYAFKKLMEGPFDLIITDIQLPGFNGLDILQGLKEIQPETPVVVLTEGEDAYSQVCGRGASAYLEKPIQPEKLRKLIQEMVPRRAL
jgi:DNA-binding response OmpR family regulator